VSAEAAPRDGLRALQSRDPYVACGRTVAYLMTIPNFARLPFGQIARLIAGQINRRQYFFVVDAAEAMVGYCGWAQTSHAAAEDWFQRNIDLGERIDATGPACVINLWQASSAAANACIVGALRSRLSPGTEIVLAKRFYPDGTLRGVRLPVAPKQLRPKPGR
jgi:hemolysin-activating ACP:hemolysin acyltransferase